MALTIKLKDLLDSSEALRALGDLTEIPAATGFKVSRAIRKAHTEITTYNEQRTKLLKATELAKAHPSMPGAMWIDPDKYPEEVEKLDAEVQAMQQVDVTIEVNQIKLNEFGAAKLKPSWLADLTWLIVE